MYGLHLAYSMCRVAAALSVPPAKAIVYHSVFLLPVYYLYGLVCGLLNRLMLAGRCNCVYVLIFVLLLFIALFACSRSVLYASEYQVMREERQCSVHLVA